MNNLGRTFTGKTSHYSPDGYGRDWYILHNNGGVFKQPCVTGFNTSPSPVQRTYSPPQPRMNAKLAKYSSDGSGRDAYILSKGGGLISDYGSKPFHITLRTWSPIKTYNKNDLYYKSQQQWMRSKAKKNTEQLELTTRLSAPKRTETSYSPSKNSKNSTNLAFYKSKAFN